MSSSPIIVALDGMEETRAVALATRLADRKTGLKVNDLLDRCGTKIVGQLAGLGAVMADPKLHDIPNTVANRARHYRDAGATFLTVHASGGIAMMRAAVDAFGEGVLAVTVLTSLGEDDAHLTYGEPAKAQTLEFARWAVLAGCAGIVCSPRELDFLAKYPEVAGLKRVVPGIRMPDSPPDDQRRTMTPAEARKSGADHLVIGRPIYEQGDPAENFDRIMASLAA